MNGARPGSRGGIEHVAIGEVLDLETAGVAPVVEQRAARPWRPSALFTSSEGQRFFATRLFESRDVLESADG